MGLKMKMMYIWNFYWVVERGLPNFYKFSFYLLTIYENYVIIYKIKWKGSFYNMEKEINKSTIIGIIVGAITTLTIIGALFYLLS